MREVGHPTGSNRRHGAEVEDLHQEPEANKESSGNESDPEENQEKDNGPDTIARIGDQKGAHHGGDGSAGAEAWHAREWSSDDLAHHRNAAAD